MGANIYGQACQIDFTLSELVMVVAASVRGPTAMGRVPLPIQYLDSLAFGQISSYSMRASSSFERRHQCLRSPAFQYQRRADTITEPSGKVVDMPCELPTPNYNDVLNSCPLRLLEDDSTFFNASVSMKDRKRLLKMRFGQKRMPFQR